MTDRPGWDEYFLIIASAVSIRSDCLRDKVGAVITRDNRIIATGYNGAPAGMAGCADAPCPRGYSGVPHEAPYDYGEGRCIALHAERNAILQIGLVACFGTTLYTTRKPCPDCEPLVGMAKFARVVSGGNSPAVLDSKLPWAT